MQQTHVSPNAGAKRPSDPSSRPTSDAQPLLARDAELAAIDGLLERSSGGAGAAFLVEGSPGVGKTRLVETTASRAGALGHDVAHARAGELGAELAFGVVRQLLEPLVAICACTDRLDWLHELAPPTAHLTTQPSPRADEQRADEGE